MSGKSKFTFNRRKLLVVFVVLSSVTLITLFYMAFGFEENYESFQKEQIKKIRKEIVEILSVHNDEDDVLDELEIVEDKYAIELLVQRDGVYLYSSSGIYSIEKLNTIFDDLVYRETYAEGEYLIWLGIEYINMIEYVNESFIVLAIIVNVIALSTIVFLTYMYEKVSVPLLRILKIVNSIKNKGNDNIAELDDISSVVLTFFNDVKLQSNSMSRLLSTYQDKNQKHIDLILEQKKYLETEVHSMKTPLSGINNSRYIIEHAEGFESLDADAKFAINNIKVQSERMMKHIVGVLNTVVENSSSVFATEIEIDVKKELENIFATNEVLLSTKNLKVSLFGECKIIRNRLKFCQLIENLTSNMIIYSRVKSELVINISNKKCEFKNVIGNHINEFSTNFGNKRVDELASELDLVMIRTIEDNVYKVEVDLEGDQNG